MGTINLSQPFLDFPTAWAIQRRGVDHTDPRCSAVQADGALLCDCGAVEAEWERLRELDEVRRDRSARP